MAICFVLKNDIQNAKYWISKLITINPSNYKAYYLLSFIDKNEAEFNLKKVISINPMYLDAWGNLAKISLEKGNISDGTNYLFPLEYLSYKNFMYYYCIGLIHKIDGKYQDAQKDFEQAIKYDLRKVFMLRKDIRKDTEYYLFNHHLDETDSDI